MTEAQLFFGRNVGGVVGVSEDDWRTFVDAEIASRFPDGFTVEDAVGQWKGADGAVVREPSKRLTVVLAGGAGNAEKLKAIRTAYKGRFHQDAVLLVRTDACAGF